MDPLTLSALIGAGASLGGGAMSFFGGGASAKDQMDFQERMFQHRYRYTMADMRKAGLNPILAGEVGGGSTPSGGVNPAAGALGSGIASAAEDLGALPLKRLDWEKAKSENEILRQGAFKAYQDAWKSKADKDTADEQAVMAKMAREVMEFGLSSAKEAAAMEGPRARAELQGKSLENMLTQFAQPGAQNEAKFQEQAGPTAIWIDRILKALGGARQVVK